MTQQLLFAIPLISTVFATATSWIILHRFYGPRPIEVESISDPIQRNGAKILHALFTWFLLWLVGTLALAGLVMAFGLVGLCLGIGLAAGTLAARSQPLKFLIVTVCVGGAFLLVLELLALAGVDATTNGYTALDQLLNPWYDNLFFILANLAAAVVTLVAVKREDISHPQPHLIPPSLPDTSAPH